MHAQVFFLAIVSLATYCKVWAQQLRLSKYPYDIFDLSTECVEALNTTVECSDLLGRHAGQVLVFPAPVRIKRSPRSSLEEEDMSTDEDLVDSELILDPLSEEALESVCTDECRSSLEGLRTTVLGACDAKEDVMIFDRHAYPATFNLDRYLHVLDVACLKDSATGTFCDLLLTEWRNETDATGAHDCHECMLEAWRVQLESPIGYDEEFAENFASVTESCSAVSYTYSIPDSYRTVIHPTGSESSTPTAEPTPCATPYTVADGDTCESIAAAQNVSSFGIIGENRKLGMFCHLPEAGTEICLPGQCRTHFLMINDNCRTLEKLYNVSRVQLASWNSNLDAQCLFIERWRYTRLCVSAPGGELDLEPPPEPTQAPTPPNAHPDSNKRCASWYTVVEGDYCDKIANDASLTTKDFYFLNQGIDENCSNLELGTAYCTKPVGDITTYPGYEVEVPENTQPGTIADCKKFHLVRADDGACDGIIAMYSLSRADFYKWNPNVGDTCTTLWLGYYVCVGI